MDQDSFGIIQENLERLRNRIARACESSNRDISAVKIIAVTKNFFHQMVCTAIDCGLTDFGENRIQEAAIKFSQLNYCRSNFTLHFIGHLQSNKVKDALELTDVIHSLDTLRLAYLINEKAVRRVPLLIQVNMTGIGSKFGFVETELDTAVKKIRGLSNIDILGLMTIAPQVDHVEDIRHIFTRLRKLNQSYGFRELSMGMTDDFEVAIEEGSTMIRIGRAIFGQRS